MLPEGDAPAYESFARVHGSWVLLPFLPESWGGIVAVGKARDHEALDLISGHGCVQKPKAVRTAEEEAVFKEQRRQKLSEAIKAKWKDPAYRAKMDAIIAARTGTGSSATPSPGFRQRRNEARRVCPVLLCALTEWFFAISICGASSSMVRRAGCM